MIRITGTYKLSVWLASAGACEKRKWRPNWCKYDQLKRIKTDFFHYKICSTYDSSPEIGSIGFATDLAYQYFPSQYIPLIVGAPFLNRFTVFGNLFARINGITFRLDRHPTMSRHPVTPMDESDLRIHLAKQTDRKIKLFDLFALEESQVNRQKHFINLALENGEIFLFDTLVNGSFSKHRRDDRKQ